jgi:hypothetical protein
VRVRNTPALLSIVTSDPGQFVIILISFSLILRLLKKFPGNVKRRQNIVKSWRREQRIKNNPIEYQIKAAKKTDHSLVSYFRAKLQATLEFVVANIKKQKFLLNKEKKRIIKKKYEFSVTYNN